MENKEDKKEGKYLGAIIFLIVIIAGAYFLNRYLNSDESLPQKDMTGSDVVGEWVEIGYMGDVDKLILNEDYLINPEEYIASVTFEDNGVAHLVIQGCDDLVGDKNHAGTDSRYIDRPTCTWEENNNSVTVHYERDFAAEYKQSYLEKVPSLTRWQFEGMNLNEIGDVTPEDLGYSGEYFLVDPYTTTGEWPEGEYPLNVYAKK